MLNALSLIDRMLAAILHATVVVASLLVVALLFALVNVRYLFGGSFLSAHELSLLSTMFLYMCGAVVASRNNDHLTVDFLEQNLSSPRHKAILRAVVALITVAVTSFFLYLVYWMFSWGMQRPQSTPVLRVPLWVPQLSMLIAAAGCLAYALRDLVRALREFAR